MRLKPIKQSLHLCVLSALAACSSYHPQPLNPQSLAEQNQAPTPAQLQILAGQIKHPLLKQVAFDLTDGLSADEAAILAVLQNPELRLARAKHGIANAQLLQAGLLPNPRVAYNFSALSGGLDTGKVQGYGISLDWEVTALLTQDQRISAAEAEQQAIDLQIAWQEWQIAQAAKLACYQLQVYQIQQKLLTDSLQRLQSNQQQLEQAVAQGWATLAESTTATSATDTLVYRQQALLQQTSLQQQRLNRALGRKPDETVALQTISLADELIVPSQEQLTQNLNQQRLDLLALQQTYQVQEEQVQIAVLQQFPKISIGPTQSKNNSNYYTVGGGIAITLPLFDQNQGAIALATATRQSVFDEYHNRDFQSKADIAELVTNITAVNAEIKTARTALESLEILFKAYTSAHRQGQVDQLTYYAAWNNLTEKQFEILNLQLHLLEARTALETATGRYAL